MRGAVFLLWLFGAEVPSLEAFAAMQRMQIRSRHASFPFRTFAIATEKVVSPLFIQQGKGQEPNVAEKTDRTTPIPQSGPSSTQIPPLDREEEKQPPSWTKQFLSSFWGPRLLLITLAAVYATNFPLGAIMNDTLPASASTSARMFVAAISLSRFLPRLSPNLRLPAMMCGFISALGYISQSLSLVDTDPAKVSFLGALTVLVCPFLEFLINQKAMGIRDAPQTWLAAVLCLFGVGLLELGFEPTTAFSFSVGDAFALSQALCFGVTIFWTNRMLSRQPDQALPVTATLTAMVALVSAFWFLFDSWMSNFSHHFSFFSLPGMLTNPSMQTVAIAIIWTGIVSTSLCNFLTFVAFARVSAHEASVLLATEPLWAALFASVFYGTNLKISDWMGGAFLVAACMANALLRPSSFR